MQGSGPINQGISYELQETKSIGACILLSFVTLGIYSLVWQYSMIKKIKLLNQEGSDCAGELLLNMFIPFYTLYWVYSRGEKLSVAANRRGIPMGNNAGLYLLLNLFGLGIITQALMQGQLNDVANFYRNVNRVMYNQQMQQPQYL